MLQVSSMSEFSNKKQQEKYLANRVFDDQKYLIFAKLFLTLILIGSHQCFGHYGQTVLSGVMTTFTA